MEEELHLASASARQALRREVGSTPGARLLAAEVPLVWLDGRLSVIVLGCAGGKRWVQLLPFL